MEKLDPKLVGMSVGFKNLYSGKEDKHGRFTWSDKIPVDIGKPAEDAETQKWALIVRYSKAWNDSSKTLQIHSIVVQSPLLKDLLETVLVDYPGFTSLQRLEFTGKLEPLIHRFPELNAAIEELRSSDTANDALRLKHAELLRDVLTQEFQAMLEASQDMKSKSVMTYEYLWTLFQPGAVVFSRQDGQERVFKLKSAKYGIDRDENPVYWLSLHYLDYDGSRFGYKLVNTSISAYNGTKPISSLSALPLEFHAQPTEVRHRLIARGAKVEAFAGTHYRTYDGIGWKLDSYGEKEKHSVNGRIVIDGLGWNRYNPNQAVYVSPLNKKGKETVGSISDRGLDPYDDACGDYSGGMPLDGHFSDDQEPSSQPALSDEQKLICTPILRGYALKEKQWLNLFVNSVHDITFNSRAFESLVLPENQKELILGFTDTQQAYRNAYDDVIEGKGRGIIILLCGPPGVGKTLTAESCAEELKVPLFTVSAADLGIDSRHVETRLMNVLGMCTRWNAICLLDEAEIFLEKRSLHELERNKIVSIFLRVLEYHEGIMFLTTNIVQNFDPAFQSRIHISLDYPELSSESRLKVWENFLKQHDISQAKARDHPPKNPNGRQIKNILKTAQLLASRKGESLKHSHIMTVLEVTQHLHNTTKETERTRNSLFA
ncbi:P-loop containing nucleoside triphosphate hydrolase protein [Delphinella strobiligena]|nr:P-loop containing nucleoside triphosphate hydrolase protein [Delphinella strobiligena]